MQKQDDKRNVEKEKNMNVVIAIQRPRMNR